MQSKGQFFHTLINEKSYPSVTNGRTEPYYRKALLLKRRYYIIEEKLGHATSKFKLRL